MTRYEPRGRGLDRLSPRWRSPRAARGDHEPRGHYALGRAATPGEIAARRRRRRSGRCGASAGAAGRRPTARRSTRRNARPVTARAAREFRPRIRALVGRDPSAEGFRFGQEPFAERTIGNYWPYATTVFDYVRRAMPQTSPGSLTNDEVYAITAYLLAANQVIPPGATLDAATLAAVKMPYVNRFVRDDRTGGPTVK